MKTDNTVVTGLTGKDLELKAAFLEKELSELNQIFQMVAGGVVVINNDFKILKINDTFTSLTGFSEKEAIGQKCYEIFPGDLCHTSGCPMVRISCCVERIEYEAEKHHRSGKTIPCIVTATPLRGPDGEMIGIVEDFKDISGFKQIQADLQQSFEKLRKAMGGIIHAISLTIEKRDPYTAGHQRRVAKLSHAIAEGMGFSRDRIDGIRMAAAVHDLGKIHVPAAILSKPGRLTENEFAIIKLHPQIGFDVLKEIDFSWPVAQTVLQHHERMDGSGYPYGLLDDDILEEAKVLAVADVVEAMSSHRPYRPALGIDKAIEEISGNKDILYDPDVVDVCINLFDKNEFKF